MVGAMAKSLAGNERQVRRMRWEGKQSHASMGSREAWQGGSATNSQAQAQKMLCVGTTRKVGNGNVVCNVWSS